MVNAKILIIDDNKEFVEDLCLLLQNDYECMGTYSGEQGLVLLDRKNFDLILLDIDLGPGMDGFEFLNKIQVENHPVPVVMITKDESIGTIVKAIKMGAYDYVGKKPDLSELKIIIERAIKEFGLRRENLFLKEEIKKLTGELLGTSEAISNNKNQIMKLARTNSTVLITGESGTGKELVARQIHLNSNRKDKPFVAVNCAAIPDGLFESELFGHEKGSFTGAIKRKIGKFEIADKGTLFLDEIAELGRSAQAKLLRVLEEKQFERVGGEESIRVDVRVLAATNQNLEELIKKGEFRVDLYYRINVAAIHIPPLRERKEDISLLAIDFVRRNSKELKKNVKDISQEALDMLMAYDWPGNVRELQNVIENALIYAETDPLRKEDFPPLLKNIGGYPDYETAKQQTMDRFQREYITAMLNMTDGNISETAKRMGITRQGLQKMIRHLKLNTR